VTSQAVLAALRLLILAPKWATPFDRWGNASLGRH
jgi:hypothetical protein